MIRAFAALCAAVLFTFGQNNTLDTLLGNIALRDDLSQKTLKESDGSVLVFTREDLDRMRVTTLGEIIERLPFLRYNENDYGLMDPSYIPFQPTNNNFLKVYIDDREVIDAMGTNGVQLFSQMSLNYIDHIEVYFGGVSFNIGIEPSLAIIKLYTKKPGRENSDVVNLYAGTYGTKDLNFYSAYELEDYSYLIYGEHKKAKRKKYHYNDATLSRDKHINMLYFKLQKDALRIETNIQSGSYDTFISRTLSLEPKIAKSSLKSIYAGIYYQKDGLKAYTNFSYYNVNTYVESEKLVGVLPQKQFPYIYLYDSLSAKIHEMVAESGLSQRWQWKRFHLIAGIRGRYLNNDFVQERYGEREFGQRKYKGNKSLSFYLEGKYLMDSSDVVLLSFKRDRVYEDVVQEYDRFSYRAGFIHNTPAYTLKLFGIYTSFIPQPLIFIEQESIGALEDLLQKEKVRVFAVELKRKFDLDFISCLYSRLYDKNNIIRDPMTGKIYNSGRTQTIDSVLFRFKYHFGLFESVEFKYFLAKMDYNTNERVYKGGDISYFKRVDNFDCYAGLIYRDGYSGLKAGYDLQMSLNYAYSKNLSFYVKGINLLGKALKTNYYGYDLAQNEVLTLSGVDVIDRSFLVGMEYQF